MKKYLNKLFILGLLVSITACRPTGKGAAEGQEEKVDTRKAVKTEAIKIEKISRKIRTNSTFVPKSEVAYTAPAGEVVKVNYKNGDTVKRGNLIIELKDESVRGNYLTAQANYMAAKASYEETEKFEELNVRNNLIGDEMNMISARESYEKALRGAKNEEIAIQESNLKSAEEALQQAEFTYERNKKLYEEELISEQAYISVETAYEQAKAAYDTAKNNLELTLEGTDEEDLTSLKANYDRAMATYNLTKKNVDEKVWEYTIARSKASYLSAKAAYETAKESYDDLSVETKIDGVVSGLRLKKYEETSGNQVLFTVVDESSMELISGLTGKELTELDRGAGAEIYVDDLKETFKGEIVEIDPTADATTNKFNIKVIVDNTDKKIKKGMYSKIYFFSKEESALVVTKESIVVKDLYTYVFVNNDGIARRVRVELGIGSDEKQEIITDDINTGDKIVVEGQFFLQDNEMIKEVE